MMPYEHDTDAPAGRGACKDARFRGDGERAAGVSYLRLRDQWSAWVFDHGVYEHEIHETREEALASLRRTGPWEGLEDA